MVLTKSNHPFLTIVFRTVKGKYTMGSNAVLDEEASLILCLREVFDHNAWTYF